MIRKLKNWTTTKGCLAVLDMLHYQSRISLNPRFIMNINKSK